MDVGDVGESSGEEMDEEVRGASGADFEGGSGEAVKAEPPVADEGACVAARFRVEVAEDLHD